MSVLPIAAPGTTGAHCHPGDGGGTVALAKHAVPTVGWLAYCKDTDGNLFGVMQSDPDAT